VRHIPDGVLRRIDDEPLAVPDRITDHLASCGHCSARQVEIARDTARVAQQFSAPELVLDVDVAWARLQRELESPRAGGPVTRRPPARVRPRRPWFPRVSLRTALGIGGIGIVVAGTAAAATLTTIFAPTHVAPVSLSQSDLGAIAAFAGLGDSQTLGGFSTPNGSSTLRFGAITWASGTAHPTSSLAQAATEAGFPVSLPAHLPAGVGAVQPFVVQPRVTAVVTFNAAAAGLAGKSVTLDAGPAVVAQYAGTSGADTPTLGVATMRRPTAQSTGASLSQIEAFLLGQPGISPQLAEEMRLVGDLQTTLPVPVPPGATARSVDIDGRPGVLLADSSNAAAGVVWEDGRGLLHVVVGILDTKDVLNVANQLG
jgi:hypothetical protein